MARTSATVQSATRTDSPPLDKTITATTIDATLVTNGLQITDYFNHKNTRLIIYNSDASAHTVTITAGTADPAINRGMGNYTVSIPAGETHEISEIDSSRFMQSDTNHSLYVDFDSGTTGTIYALGCPAGIG